MANSAMTRRRAERQQNLTDKLSENNPSPQGDDDTQNVQEVPPQQGGQEDETSEKYRRLQGKASALEKENYELVTEREALRKELEELKKAPPKSEKEKHEDFVKQLREDIGAEHWDYLDESEKQAFIRMAQRQEEKNRAATETAQRIVYEKDENRRSQEFVGAMDEALKKYDTTFLGLANNAEFNEWVKGSRRNYAIWKASVEGKDTEAQQDLMALAEEFFGKENNSSPTIKNAPAKPAKQPSAKITYEQYIAAIRDKRHPSRRARAQAIIDQYLKQENQNG
jgi:hypothetical protein